MPAATGPHFQTAMSLALDVFLVSREAMRATPATLDWYRRRLGSFLAFLSTQDVAKPQDIRPQHIRTFIVGLQRRGLSDWYIHGHARAIKTFLRFLHNEGIIPDNPMQRVAMPRLDKRILPAFSPDDVKRLLDACHTARDTAIVLCLLDTGCRVGEFVRLNVGDVEMKTGAVTIRQGKGNKDRVTFLGTKARKALLRYLVERTSIGPDDALWLSNTTGERLSAHGLRCMLRRLGKKAGIEKCNPHTFRRTFALWCLRNGMNIYALQQLMGHSDLTILRRYLALVEKDLESAHRRHGAVDNLL